MKHTEIILVKIELREKVKRKIGQKNNVDNFNIIRLLYFLNNVITKYCDLTNMRFKLIN